MMAQLLNYVRALSWKGWLVIIAAALVAGGAAYVALRKPSGGSSTLRVERRDLVQTVVVTGNVKAPSSIELAFPARGRIIWRPVAIGDQVKAGAPLMGQDTRDLDIQVTKAKAAFDGAKAALDQLKAGATPETLLQLANARDASYRQALAALDALLTKADKAMAAVHADIFPYDPTLKQYALNAQFSLSPSVVSDLANQVKNADANLALAHQSRAAAGGVPAEGAMDGLFQALPSLLDVVRTVLVSSSQTLSQVTPSAISQTTLNGYIADVAGARADFDASSSVLQNSLTSLQAAKDALAVREEPPRDVDIAILQAKVDGALADLALSQKQRSDAVITAPVMGTISDLKYEIGEMAEAGQPAVVMIAEGGAEIEANVPEIDVTKISVGNSVHITIDALPREEFSGHVIHIDPAETIIDGVANFKVRVSFASPDPRIRPGLTANLDIESLKKMNVLALPQFGVLESDLGTFVRKTVNGKTQDVPVTTGIRSSDGWVEILSGLSEGDEVENIGLKNSSR